MPIPCPSSAKQSIKLSDFSGPFILDMWRFLALASLFNFNLYKRVFKYIRRYVTKKKTLTTPSIVDELRNCVENICVTLKKKNFNKMF